LNQIKEIIKNHKSKNVELDEGYIKNIGSKSMVNKIYQLGLKIRKNKNIDDKIDLISRQNDYLANLIFKLNS